MYFQPYSSAVRSLEMHVGCCMPDGSAPLVVSLSCSSFSLSPLPDNFLPISLTVSFRHALLLLPRALFPCSAGSPAVFPSPALPSFKTYFAQAPHTFKSHRCVTIKVRACEACFRNVVSSLVLLRADKELELQCANKWNTCMQCMAEGWVAGLNGMLR